MASNSGRPKIGELRQWVKKVTAFSSQYNNSSWAANCVIGNPRVYPQYGDLHGAWASKDIDANQFVELCYEEAVFIDEINIYETYHAGAVKRVAAKNPTGHWETIYETPRCQKINKSRIFTPPIQRPDYPVDELRVEVDCTACGTWAELDAIELVGSKFNFEPPPPPSELADDMTELVNNPLFSDVIFLVGGQQFHGHKAIMTVRSDYFKALFCDNMKEKNSSAPIEFLDINPDAFEVVLHYIYTNTLLPKEDCTLLLEVWRVADRFVLDGLKSHLILDISNKISPNNVVDIYLEATSCLPEIEELKNVALSMMKKHIGEVVRLPNFTSLPQELMVELIQKMTEGMSIADSTRSKSNKK
ncbi:hypothetical protein FSP39_018785 [Pinctada imbricata]|uniref:BTB domain-containing protein n=1 Tax=Pinctada imbricata TaxID=66713 RepID=A0AA89C1X3_PINIB|nr:hypothetical protein FSP39_018785 [Pinctada imbricata]